MKYTVYISLINIFYNNKFLLLNILLNNFFHNNKNIKKYINNLIEKYINMNA